MSWKRENVIVTLPSPPFVEGREVVEIVVRGGRVTTCPRTDCFLPWNTMGVMGGCCGQTFRPRLQTRRRKKTPWFRGCGRSGVGGPRLDVAPFTRSIHHSFRNLSGSRESCGFAGLCAADCPGYGIHPSFPSSPRIWQTEDTDATEVTATYPRRLSLVSCISVSVDPSNRIPRPSANLSNRFVEKLGRERETLLQGKRINKMFLFFKAFF